ncbi:MAG: hypothetical protein ACFFCO_05930 [Promethearchaeota archaeon]
MRKQTIVLLTTLALLCSLTFIYSPLSARAQTAFPVGLLSSYAAEDDQYYGIPDYDFEFECTDTGDVAGVYLVEWRPEGYSDAEFYIIAADWEMTNADGDHSGVYWVSPYFMLGVASWILGGEVELYVDFTVMPDTTVVVPAGSFMCKHISYSYSVMIGDVTIDMYFETSLGVLVKYSEFGDADAGPEYDGLYTEVLVSSNLNSFLPFGLPPMLLLIIIAAVVIIIVVVIVVVVVVVRRRGS